MKYCVQCGAKLADDAKFCTSCGSSSPAAQENASKEPAKAPVQKVPAAPKPQPAPAVDAPESKPKKKSKAPAVIAIVLAVVILIGAGIIAIPKLIGNIDFTASDDSSDKVSSDDNKVDNDDQEEIDSILSDAEELAAEKDYEGALAEVQTGLEEYPKSEDLQKKAEEYAAALNAQIKETVLSEAADLADAGDYAGAMERIKTAQDTYGDDSDYQKAYDTYNQSYIGEIKTEALETAEGFAKEKDYLSAYNTIAEAIETIGEDKDLTQKLKTYEDEYVSVAITESNTLANESKYTEAIELVDKALKNFPSNTILVDQKNTLTLIAPKNFIEVCEPYHYKCCTSTLDGRTFSIAGEEYSNGIVQNDGNSGQFISNLGKKYSELSFLIGHIDKTPMCDYKVEILLDGVLHDTFEVKATDMPQTVTIPLIDKEQLIIKWNSSKHGNYSDGCEIGFANMILLSNPENHTATDETSNLSGESFLEKSEPYHYENCKAAIDGYMYPMASNEYTNGIVQNDGNNGQFISNLEKQHTELSFVVGHIDKTPMCNYKVEILLDGVLYDTFEVKATDMPKTVTIPLTDVEQLIVKWNSSNHGNYMDGCQIGFFNMLVN